jgi:hypothetical protein
MIKCRGKIVDEYRKEFKGITEAGELVTMTLYRDPYKEGYFTDAVVKQWLVEQDFCLGMTNSKQTFVLNGGINYYWEIWETNQPDVYLKGFATFKTIGDLL